MFKVIGADGKEYGPVSNEQVRDWVREGRANAQTRVLPEGQTDWIALANVPEFEDVLGRRPDNQPPVGAYSALPSDVLTRGCVLDVGACLARAAEVYRTRFGVVAGGGITYLLIQGVIFVMGLIPFIGSVFSIGSLFVIGQLLAGLYLVVLKAIRGQVTDLNDLFVPLKTNYVQLLLCYLVVALITGLAAAPGAVLMTVPIAIMIARDAVDALLVTLSAVGLILLLLPVLYLTVIWWFSLPLVLDKCLGFWQAMETSRKVVHQHWFTVFAVLLVFCLLYVVGMSLCCVGLFFAYPLCVALKMCAYETLFSEREARST